MTVPGIVATVAVTIVPTQGYGATSALLAHSSTAVVELDPSKTLVEFTLGGSLHTTRGTFQLKVGMVKANSVTSAAGGAIVVDAASGDSGEAFRDHRMKDAVLEAEQYPEITFRPRRITGDLAPSGSFRAKLDGLLQLHGTEHEVAIDTEGSLIDDQLVATGHFSIPYVEWGLKDPSLLFLAVAKQVDIDIATAGRVTWLANQNDSSRSPSVRDDFAVLNPPDQSCVFFNGSPRLLTLQTVAK